MRGEHSRGGMFEVFPDDIAAVFRQRVRGFDL